MMRGYLLLSCLVLASVTNVLAGPAPRADCRWYRCWADPCVVLDVECPSNPDLECRADYCVPNCMGYEFYNRYTGEGPLPCNELKPSAS